jgi:hypothetical protein
MPTIAKLVTISEDELTVLLADGRKGPMSTKT